MTWEPQQEPQRGRDIENGEAGAFISHQSVIYKPKPRGRVTGSYGFVAVDYAAVTAGRDISWSQMTVV